MKKIDWSEQDKTLKSLINNKLLIEWDNGKKEIIDGVEFINDVKYAKSLKDIFSVKILDTPQAKSLYAKI